MQFWGEFGQIEWFGVFLVVQPIKYILFWPDLSSIKITLQTIMMRLAYTNE